MKIKSKETCRKKKIKTTNISGEGGEEKKEKGIIRGGSRRRRKWEKS